eukprot:1160235-Pelagomonas_calceolata.AAC.8
MQNGSLTGQRSTYRTHGVLAPHHLLAVQAGGSTHYVLRKCATHYSISVCQHEGQVGFLARRAQPRKYTCRGGSVMGMCTPTTAGRLGMRVGARKQMPG